MGLHRECGGYIGQCGSAARGAYGRCPFRRISVGILGFGNLWVSIYVISVKEVLVVKLVKRSPGSDGRTPHSPDAPGRLPWHPIR